MNDAVLAQLAALKGAPARISRRNGAHLFDREPPPYNRRFLENRLAYRIQELAYGGLTEETLERLDALADEPRQKAQTPIANAGRSPVPG